ncbi:MAG TPA: M1 family metallopeptidase [Candidatus Saccharimonadaceae bacterium]|nr:M1 family metallopeptidase [Candidatus Saccharimonadaceae bacterium]
MTDVSRLITKFKPTHYNLTLDMNRSARTTKGTVVITGDVVSTDSTIAVHSKDLALESITVDGHSSEWAAGSNDEITIQHPSLSPGKHIVVITFRGTITDAMHGLYPCYYEHNGEKKEWLATQFESHHAREAFPCIDEPEAKATFDVTLLTEPSVTVLGNMPIVEQHAEDGQLVTTFATTPRMSSYLLAWVVGDMHSKSSKTKSGVDVTVWATPAQRPESLDFALSHAVQSIEFYEEYFDVAYPLPKSDHIALPDFSSGAMENWGLVTYREVALLADPATTTIQSKHYIATVISHELAHMWFGDLVTMKWWNDLWLNESFATVMEYICVDAIHPEWKIWLDFATTESVMALRRDAIDGVQPVQVDVHHPDEISTLFDGAIVYAKGARLMRMCQDFIGTEAFRKGLSSYFKEFAYGNTEADDLWRHLSEASGQDITGMMNTWISQSGYPVVHVTPDGLAQEQFFIGPHEPSDKLWPIPLGANDDKLPHLLDARELAVTIPNMARLNIRDASHFITHYTPEHLQRLLEYLAEYDELGRLQLLDEQTLLARGGVASSAQLIDLLAAYAGETTESVWDTMAIALGELKKFVEVDETAEAKLREFAGKLAKREYDRLGWVAVAGEPEADTKLRSLILGLMVYSEDSAVLAKVDEFYRAGVDALDPEIRALILSSVVKRTEDIHVIESLLEMYRTTPSADLRNDICAGLTSAKQPEYIALILEQFTDKDTIKPQDIFRWFAYLSRSRYARDATWQWLITHWDWIVDTFGGDKSYDDFPRYAAGGPVTREQLTDYKAFFEPKRSIPALARTIELGITEIEARLELLARDGDAVREKLHNL